MRWNLLPSSSSVNDKKKKHKVEVRYHQLLAQYQIQNRQLTFVLALATDRQYVALDIDCQIRALDAGHVHLLSEKYQEVAKDDGGEKKQWKPNHKGQLFFPSAARRKEKASFFTR